MISCLNQNVYEEGYGGQRWEHRTTESDMAFADVVGVLKEECDASAASTERRRYNI